MSEREDRPIELVCDRFDAVIAADVLNSEKTVPDKLYLRVQSSASSQMESIKNVLKRKDKSDDNDIPVYIFSAADRKTLAAPREMWVPFDKRNEISSKLGRILGSDNVKFTYK